MAPEVLKNEPYTTKADTFSWGVIMAEMLNGEYPWHAISEKSSVRTATATVAMCRSFVLRLSAYTPLTIDYFAMQL
jgi:serine/threonine protein kinase